MSVEVVMPQMGESITEGTVSKWLKSVGDKIDKDEAILEISTDKVDAEVPSPGGGVLLEIRHQEGETVEVGTVLAVIGEEGEAAAPRDPQSKMDHESEAAPMDDQPEPVAEEEIPTPEILTKTASASGDPSTIPANTAANKPNGDVSPSGAAAEVVMPQMGESITEGTVSKWLKAVGESVDKDEPLLEISTDKVDAEVPSPAAGKLLEIKVNEGETVEIGSVLALVGAEGSAVSSARPEPARSVEKEAAAPPAAMPEPVAKTAAAAAGTNGDSSIDELRRTRSSPLVRRIAEEHGIDITRISGSGISGRVTKSDIMSFIETGAALRPEDLLVGRSGSAAAPAPASAGSSAKAPVVSAPSAGDKVEKMSVMRKKIAEHMTMSKQTSAHVTSVYEIDMTGVAKFREANKAGFQSRYGTKLTYMPFIFQAVTNALRKFPIVNAQVSGENIVYKGDINLGMAVALDWGLIVPVIKRADRLSLSGLALAANDLADRARAKKLNPDEVAEGTFTITNPGVFGGLYGTPIINQPQVAILCVGAIEKRPRVLTTPDGDDYIAIRTMAYFALTYDHRIVDGADAERFLAFMKEYLEKGEFSL
ncbi:MAG TPA: 2-oxoglutarate dehydrogenase, E2 component, dihydrolipoamide succinyltransferase [Pyrinomonadaceae bacterium]|nr:2-oxoglutarate dehydrogenase, E2 component, dihydrolipoamide succinyltransferase [Pyrinomonadaceae bacterium]